MVLRSFGCRWLVALAFLSWDEFSLMNCQARLSTFRSLLGFSEQKTASGMVSRVSKACVSLTRTMHRLCISDRGDASVHSCSVVQMLARKYFVK